MWSISVIEAPAKEPLDRDGVVVPHCRLGPDVSPPQTALLDGAIATARHNCEGFTRRQLITATLELAMDSWFEEGIFRDGALHIPRPPLQQLESIKYVDEAGTEQTWPTASYILEAPAGETAQRARVTPSYSVTWPATRSQPGAVKVRFVAGYGAEPSSVPAVLRQGMLLEVGEMYDKREISVTGTIVSPVVLTAERLWRPLRAW